jgi:hypothetical protein
VSAATPRRPPDDARCASGAAGRVRPPVRGGQHAVRAPRGEPWRETVACEQVVDRPRSAATRGDRACRVRVAGQQKNARPRAAARRTRPSLSRSCHRPAEKRQATRRGARWSGARGPAVRDARWKVQAMPRDAPAAFVRGRRRGFRHGPMKRQWRPCTAPRERQRRRRRGGVASVPGEPPRSDAPGEPAVCRARARRRPHRCLETHALAAGRLSPGGATARGGSRSPRSARRGLARRPGHG